MSLFKLDEASLDEVLKIAIEKQKPQEEQYQDFLAQQKLLREYGTQRNSEPRALLRLVG